MLFRSAVLTSAILFIATSSAIANWIIAYDNIPKFLAEVLSKVPGGKYGFLILIDILLLLIGMTLDASPAIIIFAPLFLPIALNMGIDATHFLVLMVTGFALGLTTPPYGVCLFSISSIANIPMEKLVRKAVPFYVAMFITLVIVTFIPAISTYIPGLLGM